MDFQLKSGGLWGAWGWTESLFSRTVVDGTLAMKMRAPEERAKLFAMFKTYELKPTLEKLETMYRDCGELGVFPMTASKAVCWSDLAVFDVVRYVGPLPNPWSACVPRRAGKYTRRINTSCTSSRSSTHLAHHQAGSTPG